MTRSQDHSRRVIVLTLGTTQTLAWASSYYLAAVLADPVAVGLHLSRSWFFGIFSISLLLTAGLGPTIGRVIDRRGGRGVLVSSNVAFAAGLLLLATASGVVSLVVAWMVLGVAMALGLYEPAFSTLAGIYGRDARGPITGITLIAGFASTIGWPLTSYLVHTVGWREACAVWAALHVLLGLPLNRLLLPKAPPPDRHSPAGEIEPADAGRTLVLLSITFGAAAFVTGAIAAHLPRLLIAVGVRPDAAIAAAALVGPAQVAARLVEFSVLRRFSPLASARLATLLHPLGAACFVVLGAPAAIVLTLLHGAGNGLLTIARGTLPLALFGPGGYGLRTGLLVAPARVTQAAAPFLFGLLLDRFGPNAALYLSGSIGLVAFGALATVRSRRSEALRSVQVR